MKMFIFTGETLQEAREFMVSSGDKKYRADQVFKWIYKKNVFDPVKMTDLPSGLIPFLNKKTRVVSVSVQDRRVSKRDRTSKYLFRLNDGNCIESAFLPYEKRNTACLSAQVGCPLGCMFCATGKQGFIRNLSADEIVGQYLIMNRDAVKETGRGITNIVLMGMGEPFLNYDSVFRALEILSEPWGAGMSPRRITISTSGIITGINRLISEKKRYKLSISLHSPFDEKRRKLIPVNKKYSIKRLLDAIDRYIEATGMMVTFQYLLIGGFNDAKADAGMLAEMLKDIKCKVNIIIYNRVADLPFKKPPEKSVERFMSILASAGIKTTIRKSRGDDIDSGCGQLRQRHIKPER